MITSSKLFSNVKKIYKKKMWFCVQVIKFFLGTYKCLNSFQELFVYCPSHFCHVYGLDSF